MPFKQQEVRSLVHSNNVALFGLMETRVDKKNSSKIASAILKGWRVFLTTTTTQMGESGYFGILIYWK